MSSMTVENLANTLVTIEASSSRFVKSMSTAIDDWKELKARLDLAKKMLEGGFADLERREKRFQSIHAFRESAMTHENSVESRQDEVEKELRVVKSNMMAMNVELEKLQQQLSNKSSHEVNEGSSLRIAPLEPKSNKKTVEGNKRLTSEAWKHFTKIPVKNGIPKFCKCNYCFKEYSCRSTRNLLQHIGKGKCPAYQDLTGANKRLLGDASSSSAQMSQAKKLRAEMVAGKQVQVRNEMVAGKQVQVRNEMVAGKQVQVRNEMVAGKQVQVRNEMVAGKQVQVRNEMVAGKQVQVENGFLNPNETNNEKILDYPPPGFKMNLKHANLLLMANKEGTKRMKPSSDVV